MVEIDDKDPIFHVIYDLAPCPGSRAAVSGIAARIYEKDGVGRTGAASTTTMGG